MQTTMMCPSCNGKGEREISKTYAKTLQALRLLRRGTCAEIASAMRFKDPRGTTVHKRIARMEKWHLVKRIGQKLPPGETDTRKRAWVFEAI